MNEETENAVEQAVSLATLNVRLGQIEETLKKIDKALNGNGHDGVITRVARLEERLNVTWKTLLIIGWLADFLIAAGALIAVIIRK